MKFCESMFESVSLENADVNLDIRLCLLLVLQAIFKITSHQCISKFNKIKHFSLGKLKRVLYLVFDVIDSNKNYKWTSNNKYTHRKRTKNGGRLFTNNLDIRL